MKKKNSQNSHIIRKNEFFYSIFIRMFAVNSIFVFHNYKKSTTFSILNCFACCNRDRGLKAGELWFPKYCQHQVYSDLEFEWGLIQNTCTWLGRKKRGLKWFLGAVVEIEGWSGSHIIVNTRSTRISNLKWRSIGNRRLGREKKRKKLVSSILNTDVPSRKVWKVYYLIDKHPTLH